MEHQEATEPNEPFVDRLYNEIDKRNDHHAHCQMQKFDKEDKELEEMDRIQKDRLAKHGNYIRSVDQFMAD